MASNKTEIKQLNKIIRIADDVLGGLYDQGVDLATGTIKNLIRESVIARLKTEGLILDGDLITRGTIIIKRAGTFNTILKFDKYGAVTSESMATLLRQEIKKENIRLTKTKNPSFILQRHV